MEIVATSLLGRTGRPLEGCIVLEFGLVSLGLHCFLRLSCAGLTVGLIPGYCWAHSAFSV